MPIASFLEEYDKRVVFFICTANFTNIYYTDNNGCIGNLAVWWLGPAGGIVGFIREWAEYLEETLAGLTKESFSVLLIHK